MVVVAAGVFVTVGASAPREGRGGAASGGNGGVASGDGGGG